MHQHTPSSFPFSPASFEADLGAELPVEPGPDQRWTTWTSVTKGQRGPEPRPDWVVTADAALDTELGVLKTGKEADVFLVERAVPDDPTRRSFLAAKRYRGRDHRQFHRDGEYTDGRRTRRTRDQRAIEDRKSSWGKAMAATQWADAEFLALSRLWDAGAPVPYPVQIDGTELLLEFVGAESADGTVEAAPRLARTRPDAGVLADWFDQLRDAMGVIARLGWAHGDLSPYNILVDGWDAAAEDPGDGGRLVIIDLPQVVDLVANPFGADLLHRDCRNVCAWFAARGLDVDADELFADVFAQAW
ncbi:serine protein kinase RIO [Krasilnikoviella flava]|uniref:non-specific serine/threonine protein kinase n=1 Tax=Krasilnikoviella flava TaxID=526729 RepID=A0A1T5M3M8_9MICO|nr:RIO1 family regulatory kinase/ATPase [Krasilnikoviella flava]SKC82735.1 RIO kinase 1 [Krasilnikoviella flava]